MVDETQNDVVLIFNLSHDVMVKFRADGSCTLEAFGQDAAPVRLLKDQQLLLMDAICRYYSFPSPVASLVTSSEVGQQEDDPDDDEDGEGYTMSPLPPLPSPGGPT